MREANDLQLTAALEMILESKKINDELTGAVAELLEYKGEKRVLADVVQNQAKIIQSLENKSAALTKAVLNQCGDNLCWITDPVKAKAIPEPEFLESCRRYRNQIASENGELTGQKTIAQLEAEIERLNENARELVAVGHKHGWNGVENSKFLWAFFDTKIMDLKNIVDQVDDVLVVNWVGPRVDGDYRKALADLVSTNIDQTKYFSESDNKDAKRITRLQQMVNAMSIEMQAGIDVRAHLDQQGAQEPPIANIADDNIPF